MAKTVSKILNSKINWQESYPSLILGAIIVIIIGLLIANYFSRKNIGEIGTTEQTEQTQEQQSATLEQTYKVAANDSLSKISEKVYGSQEFWPTIAKVNNITNPNIIFVDAELKLPPKSEIEQAQQVMTVTSYQVQQGETFFIIAEKVYGDGSMWTRLHQANGAKSLPNGNPLVLAGSTIVVPR